MSPANFAAKTYTFQDNFQESEIMATVLVFAGEKYEAKGGAADLCATLSQATVPTDGEISEIFKRTAISENWHNDDFWVNALVIDETGVPRMHKWHAYIRDTVEDFDREEAPYATVQGDIGVFKFMLVPLVDRMMRGHVPL